MTHPPPSGADHFKSRWCLKRVIRKKKKNPYKSSREWRQDGKRQACSGSHGASKQPGSCAGRSVLIPGCPELPAHPAAGRSAKPTSHSEHKQHLQLPAVLLRGRIAPGQIEDVPVRSVIYARSEPGRNSSNNHPRTVLLGSMALHILEETAHHLPGSAAQAGTRVGITAVSVPGLNPRLPGVRWVCINHCSWHVILFGWVNVYKPQLMGLAIYTAR